ncbi:MAG: bifunctional riboflavin kinase/FMN adenylyltransferase [Ruminococcaceae bacterium]|nr:bifunctional riboflavin kinase/FMN adenylyltransferase [Oscillospiraceae bacterium]
MLIHNTIPELSSSAAALGFFDGLHPGHEAVIRSACESEHTGVVLSIGSRERMASRLLIDDDRDMLLESMGADMLIAPPFEDIREMAGEEFFHSVLMDKLHARKVVCGYNFRFGRGAACGAEELSAMCAEAGVECVVIPQVTFGGEAVSARRLRSLLDEGSVAEYASVLGRRYSYRLEVVTGQKLGRKLGFPTINQNLPEYLHLPRYGVYASVVRTPDGIVRPAVTNIGVRPTVGSPIPLSETWIMDYDADLYGQWLRVELVDFIRPEQRFDSLDALKYAIRHNAGQAAEMTRGITTTTLP